MTKTLAFLETWGSRFIVALAVLITLLPVLAVLARYIVIPSTFHVISGEVVIVVLPDDTSFYPTTWQNVTKLTPIASNVEDGRGNRVDTYPGEVNVTEWLSNDVQPLYVANFFIAGLASAVVVARPLELKYFFVELTFTGSRRRLLFERIALVLSLLAFAVFMQSLVTYAIAYVKYGELVLGARVYLYVLARLLLPVVTAVLAGALVSVVFKNGLAGVLCFIPLIFGVYILSTLWSDLVEVVLGGARVFRDVNGATLYSLYVALLIVLIAVVGERVEY